MTWDPSTEDALLALSEKAMGNSSPWFLNYVPDRDSKQHGVLEDADLWHNGGPGGTIATIHCCTTEDSSPAHYIEAAVNALPEAIREIRRLRASLQVSVIAPTHGGWRCEDDGYTHESGWRVSGNGMRSWLLAPPPGGIVKELPVNITGVKCHGFTVRADVAELMDLADEMIAKARAS